MADLMKGKRGLIMGVANERSIAWGIAQAPWPTRARNWPFPIRARPLASGSNRWPPRSGRIFWSMSM